MMRQIGSLLVLMAGIAIGARVSAPQQSAPPLMALAEVNGTLMFVPLGATPMPTPTPIGANVTPTFAVTATRTPNATPTMVTPALATHTPQITPTYSGMCGWVVYGAEWYQPAGRAYYEYTDPNGSGIAQQNVREGPGTAYPIVGSLPKGVARLVWFVIDVGDQRWVSLDEGCRQWVAVWLGFIDVK
jgi:hypothetical protein